MVFQKEKFSDIDNAIQDYAKNIEDVIVHPHGIPLADIHITSPCVEVVMNHHIAEGRNSIFIQYRNSQYKPKRGDFYNSEWGNGDLEILIYQALAQNIRFTLNHGGLANGSGFTF